MKTYLYTFIIALSINVCFAYASSISLVQTTDIYTGLVTYNVMLDPEGENVNAFSGGLVYPNDMLSVESISTEGSVVPLWLTQPSVSNEDSVVSAKARIAFEGALPGGFDGVYNLYHPGKNSGKLFSVTFRPKKEGVAFLEFEDLTVLQNDGNATKDAVTSNTASLTIPNLKTLPTPKKALLNTDTLSRNNTLSAYVTKDNTIAGDKWVLIINDDLTQHTLLYYEVAESVSYDINNVAFYEWEKVTSPFVLNAQKRNRFIHVKAVYADGTYNRIVIAPVENIERELTIWRILVVLAIGLILLYLLQKKHSLHGKNV